MSGADNVVWLGTPSFPEAARAALADTRLRANLRRATGTIRDRRLAVTAELDDWEDLRETAAAVKRRTLRHLDRHLLRLEETVTAAGGTVHWAADAAEANAIVTRLVRATGESEIVKAKSMATQEIGLNEALAEAGIRAYETDLAELIVQLGGDRPSHILVPAIHRGRSEIREIFRREMGKWGRPAAEGLTDDPRDLAEAARLHLREKFLRAKVAVSGAHFAAADTGTVVVVESEGNGRMCLTLPETLITVMGIEKVLPSFTDLDVFLRLLPRSSTGERMSPYTSSGWLLAVHVSDCGIADRPKGQVSQGGTRRLTIDRVLVQGVPGRLRLGVKPGFAKEEGTRTMDWYQHQHTQTALRRAASRGSSRSSPTTETTTETTAAAAKPLPEPAPAR
ncbi:LUD domain-containing protein [Streptomyces sp. NPDC001714]|uniref:LUD domain-containing protein n=1 Tax=Streptomyces sp. NPDC001714 TaxID=3364603 RepID=UPI00369CAF2A